MTGLEKASLFLETKGYRDRVIVFEESTATVALAAQAVGCEDARIAKTLSFYDLKNGGAIAVVAAGDAKVDNKLFKDCFEYKAKMLKGEDVNLYTGYEPGGVCPFDLPSETKIYLDESLYRFETIYPACGNAASAVKLRLSELEEICTHSNKVDVCKGWR